MKINEKVTDLTKKDNVELFLVSAVFLDLPKLWTR